MSQELEKQIAQKKKGFIFTAIMDLVFMALLIYFNYPNENPTVFWIFVVIIVLGLGVQGYRLSKLMTELAEGDKD